jgi:hypothetical protein
VLESLGKEAESHECMPFGSFWHIDIGFHKKAVMETLKSFVPKKNDSSLTALVA